MADDPQQDSSMNVLSLLRPSGPTQQSPGPASSSARWLLRLTAPDDYEATLNAERHYRLHGVFPSDFRQMSGPARRYLHSVLGAQGVPWSPLS